MTLETVFENIRELSDRDFDQLRRWIHTTEQTRREKEELKRIAQAELVAEMASNGQIRGAKATTMENALAGRKIPEWVDPEGDVTKMYLPGAVVRVEETVFLNERSPELNGESPLAANAGWGDVTEDVNKPKEGRGTGPNGSAERPWPWEVGRNLSKGHHVEYEGVVYKVGVAHVVTSDVVPGQEGDEPERYLV